MVPAGALNRGARAPAEPMEGRAPGQGGCRVVKTRSEPGVGKACQRWRPGYGRTSTDGPPSIPEAGAGWFGAHVRIRFGSCSVTRIPTAPDGWRGRIRPCGVDCGNIDFREVVYRERCWTGERDSRLAVPLDLVWDPQVGCGLPGNSRDIRTRNRADWPNRCVGTGNVDIRHRRVRERRRKHRKDLDLGAGAHTGVGPRSPTVPIDEGAHRGAHDDMGPGIPVRRAMWFSTDDAGAIVGEQREVPGLAQRRRNGSTLEPVTGRRMAIAR